ncbi:MAG: nucleoside triphosphate pyrophosphohydrolase [Paraclostridium sordellii]|uniref:Bifunctional tetrapyrrolemethylase/nucleoside triphosphate pyrophosphohydrolase n=3 Tax=Clostridia TaxID=186801 RepID=A0A0C7LYU5_PARSO|nr:nucleoside triphosphate pyrophosphohydrolase [Paeniclostridium sordellii]CEN80651.1 bifunctional tetrapyrrolemethylase/nucleoside triphosphate pyrophosphohydrolase [[Clostridium] sordellii] [Paeniclostridium sordellii]CEP41591.1 bifunctional tetrapyrrolemethylase/nucleoside triphosphate pyrophosphohydrolase [[Clostridium] sordellii] [Paeniclostridium sordellii]CEP47050.1 bifunctional tetrapyrrolemethylase/nucleoside triphosphate pyrophosphohydrolase [[Clostridium] sordellii] [Paeniclostridium
MGKITIVGLGPGEYSLISQGALEILRNNDRIFLRTEKHPIMDKLKNEIKYKSLDNFYNEDEDFDNVYNNISNFIIEESKNGDLVYVVPGHPRVAEKTVSIISDIASKKGIEVEIIASMSFVDAMFNYLGLDPSVGFKLVDAFEIENSYIDTNTSMIITQIYDRFIASNVKLALMECYDDEQEICIVRAAGVKNLESKKYVKLYELDRNENDFDYLTSLYIPKSEKTMYNTVKDLENIVENLRGENGCEWDKKQTHESLKEYIIEEAYELANAIDNDDIDEMIEELGDILLHVVFHSQIGKEEGYFDLKEVVQSICEKLIYRHPHVFKNEKVDMNTYDKTWETLKKEEKGESTITEGLKRIPKNLPALIKAKKVQYKASLVGFDWDNIEEVFKKIVEEYKELLDEHKQGNIKYIKEELGDLLFSIVNLTRFLDINPEEALNLSTEKFIKRFEFIENTAISLNKDLESMTLEEMDDLWNESKNK